MSSTELVIERCDDCVIGCNSILLTCVVVSNKILTSVLSHANLGDHPCWPLAKPDQVKVRCEKLPWIGKPLCGKQPEGCLMTSCCPGHKPPVNSPSNPASPGVHAPDPSNVAAEF